MQHHSKRLDRVAGEKSMILRELSRAVSSWNRTEREVTNTQSRAEGAAASGNPSSLQCSALRDPPHCLLPGALCHLTSHSSAVLIAAAVRHSTRAH